MASMDIFRLVSWHIYYIVYKKTFVWFMDIFGLAFSVLSHRLQEDFEPIYGYFSEWLLASIMHMVYREL